MNAGSVGERVEPLAAHRCRAAAPGRGRVASHASGSTQRNRSRVCSSHDQRRFMAERLERAQLRGEAGRTVKLRSAFIASDVRPGLHAEPGGRYRVPPWRARSEALWRRRKGSRSRWRRCRCRTRVPGEALVQVQACGVCHTDLHYREGGDQRRLPVPARSRGGRCRRGGRATASRVSPGDFVILNWRAVCGQCRAAGGDGPGTASPPTTHAEDDAPTARRCRPRSASARSPRRRSWPRDSAPRSTSGVAPRPRGCSAAA